MSKYVVKIDGRTDGGCGLVGPFDSPSIAEKWAEHNVSTFVNDSSAIISYEIWPMATPKNLEEIIGDL